MSANAPESSLEARCCLIAARKGCKPIKLGGFVVGLPDRAFLLPGSRVWLVEFKTPIGQVSERQKYHFSEFARLGHPVTLARSTDSFRRDLFAKLGLPPPSVQKELDLS